MAIFDDDSLMAVRMHDGRILCMACFEGDVEDLAQDEIIFRDEVERGDKIYFCDECNERL